MKVGSQGEIYLPGEEALPELNLMVTIRVRLEPQTIEATAAWEIPTEPYGLD